jgi:hypothetical protein
LSHGQSFLPPDVFGVHRDKVIGIHNGVDEAIENNGEVHITIISYIDIEPIELEKQKEKRR